MSYCTDCIHYKVCGNEGVDDSAMTFCEDKKTSGDLISKSVLDQVKWERDIAIEQLKDLGYELGEKPRTDGDLISRDFMKKLGATCIAKRSETGELVAISNIDILPSAEKTTINPEKTTITDTDLISRQAVLDIFGDIHPLDYNARAYVAQIKELPSAEKTAEETNLTSEELFDLDIEQNVKDIDSGEDDSYYRGRLAGMLSAYRILKGKPYEEGEQTEMANQECDNNHDCEHCDWTECPLEVEKETEGAK